MNATQFGIAPHLPSRKNLAFSCEECNQQQPLAVSAFRICLGLNQVYILPRQPSGRFCPTWNTSNGQSLNRSTPGVGWLHQGGMAAWGYLYPNQFSLTNPVFSPVSDCIMVWRLFLFRLLSLPFNLSQTLLPKKPLALQTAPQLTKLVPGVVPESRQ